MDVLYPFLLTWLLVTGEAQDCPDPVGGANMNLKDGDILLKSFPEGITVTFVCSVGYVSEGGSGATKCSAGAWSTRTLRCMKKSCGSAGEVENGNIDYKAGNEFGDTITISCNQGYMLVGKAQMTCGDKGWLGRLPLCEVVVCDPPSPIKSGTLYPHKVSYDYRDVIQYTCDPELTLNGTNSISCSVDGKFKPDPPTCIRVECPEPKIYHAEWVEGSRPPHVYRAIVKYRCLTGFVMKGEQTLTCQIDNKWSPPEPVCEPVTCHPPTMMEKGIFRPNKVSYDYGEVVEYSCETGFELIGEKSLSCSDDGTFKPSPPTCKSVTCHPPTMMEKGIFRPNKVSYDYGEVVEYSCETGFELIGEKSLSCSDDGTFKPSPPTCKSVTCHPPTMMEKGIFRPNKVSYDYGEVVEYSCETGFELIGEKSLSCSDDGTFKPSPPTCKSVTCHPPTMMEKGIFRPNKVSYDYGEVVEYSCETGFELIGEKSLSCSDDGTFKPSPPTCKFAVSTIPTKTVTTPTKITTTTTSAAPSGPDLGTIAKGVGGFLAALVLFLVLFFGCRKLFEKMYRSGKDHTDKEDPNPDEEVALADRKGAGVESS